jgi:alanine dehydrogenase
VTAEDLQIMKPGAVVIDVCIDQGGCFETSRPTTHSAPTYLVDGILHYCVTNMPGAVGRTSTYALCNVTFPYLKRIVSEGLPAACQRDPGLAAAVNLLDGRITNQAVAETFGLPLSSLFQ